MTLLKEWLTATRQERVTEGEGLVTVSDLSWAYNSEAQAIALYMLDQSGLDLDVQLKILEIIES